MKPKVTLTLSNKTMAGLPGYIGSITRDFLYDQILFILPEAEVAVVIAEIPQSYDILLENREEVTSWWDTCGAVRAIRLFISEYLLTLQLNKACTPEVISRRAIAYATQTSKDGKMDEKWLLWAKNWVDNIDRSPGSASAIRYWMHDCKSNEYAAFQAQVIARTSDNQLAAWILENQVVWATAAIMTTPNRDELQLASIERWVNSEESFDTMPRL
jgi:hypothetical protein